MPGKGKKKKNKNNNNNRLPIDSATPNLGLEEVTDQQAVVEPEAIDAQNEASAVPVRTTPQVHVSILRASLSEL